MTIFYENIQENKSILLNDDIFSFIMLKTLSGNTCYIETRLVYFRLIHSRVMTNKVLFKNVTD